MSGDYMAQAEAIFRRMLATGKPVAFEDAAKAVETDEDVDRRCFGSIPARLRRDGLIVEAGYRLSNSAKHNYAIKRLWRLADLSIAVPSEPLPRFEVPSGRLVVADPMYLTNKDLAVVLTNAKPGQWMVTVGHHENFVSCVTVFHESELSRDGAVDRELMHRVGVDTARVCIVDSRSIGSYQNADWADGVKVDRFGLIVPSGFGDWIYEACVREFKGQAVSIRIVFIDTEGDE
jgi:hypothetical protein